MRKICYIIAMRAEAAPMIEHLRMEHKANAFAPLPCQLYTTQMQGMEVNVVINGVDHERDLIGCEAAAVTTMAAIQRLQPDIVISSGTCGGWAKYNAQKGAVYIADGVMFHDRHVPGDNEWDTQGLGNYPVWSGAKALAKRLGLPMGKVTTGSSFDLTTEDARTIDDNGGRLKEMEGAAVAFVCHLYNVPVMLVKAVTNLRDAAEDNMDDFHASLKQASENLLHTNLRIIEALKDM